MKKIILLLLLSFSFFQIKLVAQGCDYYFYFSASAVITGSGASCSTTITLGNVYVINGGVPYSSSYSSSTIPNSIEVWVGVNFSGCVAGSPNKTVSFNTSGCTAGNNYNSTQILDFYVTSGQDDAHATVRLTCTYSCRPKNATGIAVTPNTILNDGDEIHLEASPFYQNYEYQWHSQNDLLFSLPQSYTSNELDFTINIGNNNLITNPVSVLTHIGQDESCYPFEKNLYIYPRRPIIADDDISATAPSCKGDGDGTIIINNIDGALGTGTGEGSVIAYKITVAKENNQGEYIALSINADSDTIRYINTIPQGGLILNKNSFWGNEPLPAGNYLVMVENSYQVDDNTVFNNGHTFTNITIPQKTPLTAYSPDSRVNCHSYTDGTITLTANSGNLIDYAYLFDSFDNLIRTASFGLQDTAISHTFTDLPADTYYIQLIDQHNCDIAGQNDNYTGNIEVTEPLPLEASLTDTIHAACKGDSTGVLEFYVQGGTMWPSGGSQTKDHIGPYYNYILKDIFFNPVSIGKSNSSGEINIENLPVGSYRLTVIDKFTCPVNYTDFDNEPDGIPVPPPFGTYSITEPKTLVQIDNIIIKDYNGIQISCNGYNDGQITVYSQGGTGDHDYSYFGLESHGIGFSETNIISGLPPDIYKLTVKDENDCTFTHIDSFTINEPEVLIISNTELSNYHGENISCTGYNDGYIDIFTKGGWGNKRYIHGIDTLYNTNRTDSLFAGFKSITVIDTNNCEITVDTTLIQPSSKPAIESIDTISYNGYGVHCFGDTDGRLTVHPLPGSGTTTTGNYFTFSIDTTEQETFQNDSVFTELSADIFYKFKIKDANGCLDSLYKKIDQPAPLNFTYNRKEYGTFNIQCNGDSNGSFSIDPSGGVYTQTYSYFKDGSPIGNDTAFNLPAGTYTAHIQDANNCISESQDIELIEPDEITFAYDTSAYPGGNAIRCFDMQDSVLIVPYGGFGANIGGHYNVKLNSVTKPINPPDTARYFTIVADTNYDIEISDGNGCIIDSPNIFSVTQPPKMQYKYSDAISTLCHNTADGKINIAWEGGTNHHDYLLDSLGVYIDSLININTTDTVTFNNISTGSYKIIARDKNFCLDSLTKFVSSPPILLANTTDTDHPPCYGDTLGNFTVSGTGGTTQTPNFYDFYIKTSYGDSIFIADTNQAVFEEIATGTHDYFIIDDNNCISDPDSFDITEPDEMIVSFETENVSSQGGSDGSATANVIGGTNTFDYVWRNSDDVIVGGNENNITDVTAGDYSVEVWDDNDCPYNNSSVGLTQFVTIYEPGQALELYIVQQHNVSSPGGNDGSVTLDALGGWGQNRYKMQGGIYTPANIFENLSQGTYWFYVTDDFSTDSLSTTIIEAEELQIQTEIHNIECYNENNGYVNIIATGGTAPYTYSLDDITYVENNTFDELSEGTYTAYVKDYYNISTSEDFSILQPEELTLNFENVQHTACGSAEGSATATASGGTPPYLYYWEYSGQYGATAENLQAGTYTVTVTDDNLCTTTNSVIINNSDGPEITSINIENAQCYNTADGTATVNVTSGTAPYTFTWSNGTSGNENYITGLLPDNYTVEVTDASGCFTSSLFTIASPDSLCFNFNINNPMCYNACNGSITANLSGGTTPYTMEWQNINGNPNTNHVSGLCADDYILNVIDANTCEYSGIAAVENPEQIQILEEDQATLCQGQSITLDAGNLGSTYQWTSDNGFQSTERIVTLNEADTYYITVINNIGCTGEDEFTLNFSDSFLQANFLMQSEAEIGDTVVLVEISWEEPDSVSWNFPDELWLLSQSEQNVQLVPTQNGVYTVGLTAYLGTCSDFIEKQITINGNGNKDFDLPEYATDEKTQFKSVNLYPNPNKGNFTLDIKLYKKDDIRVEVYNILGQKQKTHKTGKDEKNYTFNYNINNLKNGLYFISIKTNKGSAGIKFIKQ